MVILVAAGGISFNSVATVRVASEKMTGGRFPSSNRQNSRISRQADRVDPRRDLSRADPSVGNPSGLPFPDSVPRFSDSRYSTNRCRLLGLRAGIQTL